MKRLLALLLVTLTAVCCFGCGTESEIVIRTAERTTASASGGEVAEETMTVIVNKNTKKYHLSEDCAYVKKTAEENRMTLTVSGEDELLFFGYSPCSYCAKKEPTGADTTDLGDE